MRSISADRSFIVYSGDERHPKADGVDAIGLAVLMALLAEA